MTLASRNYINSICSGVHWHLSMPTNPLIGDCYTDSKTYKSFIWDGNAWVLFSTEASVRRVSLEPNQEELDNHPSLKQAWEEYLVIRKLLGL